MTKLTALHGEITGDSSSLEAAAARGKKAIGGLNTALAGQQRGMARVTRSSGAFSRGIQNASFQLGDFATQVGAGTSASIALGQQLPQLLGGFGILGAVLGAVVAIGVPLTRVFMGMADSGRDLSSVLGVLQPAAERLGEAFQTVAQFGVVAAEAIINNLDRILITAGTVATFMAGRWVSAFVAARISTLSLAGALGVLRTALIRSGIGALVIAAGEMVYQFTRLTKAAGGFGEAMSLLGQLAREVFLNMGAVAQGFWNIIKGVAKAISGAFLSAFSVIGNAWDALVNGMAKAWNAIAGSTFGQNLGLGQLPTDNDTGGSMAQTGEALRQSGISDIRAGGGMLSDSLPALGKIRDLLASMRDEGLTLPDILGVGGDDGEGGGGKGGKKKSLSEKLSDQKKAVAKHLADIRALTESGLSGQLGAWGNYFDSLAGLMQSGNEKLLKIAKAFSAGQALVNAWLAYTEVLKDPSFAGNPLARLAAAAKVLAAGIGAVNAIKSVGQGGSGGGGGASGAAAGGGGGAAAQNTSPRVALQLTGGDMFSRDQVVQLINKINEAQEDGAIVRLV